MIVTITPASVRMPRIRRCDTPTGESGFGGAGVLEVTSDFRGDTFRAVYTVRYSAAVYVLHAFQKKSTTGRQTPRRDIELIWQRLREAEQIAKETEQ